MEFDFETAVDRENIGNMKHFLGRGTPRPLVLSGAEMDFATAPCIREALETFSARGIYGYTLADGAYTDAVCAWMKLARGTAVLPEEIVPAMGTVFALGTAVRAFTNPGDGVIVQHPSYYRYDVNIEGLGRRVVSDPLTERGGEYSMDFDHLETLMAKPENKLFVLCNPHNPTGRVFPAEDLERIAALSARYGVTVFSDEIFAEVCFNGHRTGFYADVDKEHGITSTSLGKAFNFTGVNQANLIIKNAALRETYFAQRQSDHFGSIDPFFYTALRAGYTGDGLRWIKAMNEHVYGIYTRICDRLKAELPALRLSPLEGGFVAWMDFRALGADDAAFEAALQKAGIVADPGLEYGPGGAGFIRLNLATTSAMADAFVERLVKACEGVR